MRSSAQFARRRPPTIGLWLLLVGLFTSLLPPTAGVPPSAAAPAAPAVPLATMAAACIVTEPPLGGRIPAPKRDLIVAYHAADEPHVLVPADGRTLYARPTYTPAQGTTAEQEQAQLYNATLYGDRGLGPLNGLSSKHGVSERTPLHSNQIATVVDTLLDFPLDQQRQVAATITVGGLNTSIVNRTRPVVRIRDMNPRADGTIDPQAFTLVLEETDSMSLAAAAMAMPTRTAQTGQMALLTMSAASSTARNDENQITLTARRFAHTTSDLEAKTLANFSIPLGTTATFVNAKIATGDIDGDGVANDVIVVWSFFETPRTFRNDVITTRIQAFTLQPTEPYNPDRFAFKPYGSPITLQNYDQEYAVSRQIPMVVDVVIGDVPTPRTETTPAAFRRQAIAVAYSKYTIRAGSDQPNTPLHVELYGFRDGALKPLMNSSVQVPIGGDTFNNTHTTSLAIGDVNGDGQNELLMTVMSTRDRRGDQRFTAHVGSVNVTGAITALTFGDPLDLAGDTATGRTRNVAIVVLDDDLKNQSQTFSPQQAIIVDVREANQQAIVSYRRLAPEQRPNGLTLKPISQRPELEANSRSKLGRDWPNGQIHLSVATGDLTRTKPLVYKGCVPNSETRIEHVMYAPPGWYDIPNPTDATKRVQNARDARSQFGVATVNSTETKNTFTSAAISAWNVGIKAQLGALDKTFAGEAKASVSYDQKVREQATQGIRTSIETKLDSKAPFTAEQQGTVAYARTTSDCYQYTVDPNQEQVDLLLCSPRDRSDGTVSVTVWNTDLGLRATVGDAWRPIPERRYSSICDAPRGYQQRSVDAQGNPVATGSAGAVSQVRLCAARNCSDPAPPSGPTSWRNGILTAANNGITVTPNQATTPDQRSWVQSRADTREDQFSYNFDSGIKVAAELSLGIKAANVGFTGGAERRTTWERNTTNTYTSKNEYNAAWQVGAATVSSSVIAGVNYSYTYRPIRYFDSLVINRTANGVVLQHVFPVLDFVVDPAMSDSELAAVCEQRRDPVAIAITAPTRSVAAHLTDVLPAPTLSFTASVSPTVTGVYADPSTILTATWTAVPQAAGYRFLVSDVITADLTLAPVASNTAMTFPLPETGTWYFHVQAVDAAGVGGTPARLPFTVDTVAPAITVSFQSATPPINNWYTDPLIGTVLISETDGVEPLTSEYSLDDGSTWQPVASDGRFTITQEASVFTTVLVRGRDAANNTSVPVDYRYRLDTDGPILSNVAATVERDPLTAQAYLVVRGTTSDDAPHDVELRTADGNVVRRLSIITANDAFEPRVTTWSTTLDLAPGDYTIQVQAIDAAERRSATQTVPVRWEPQGVPDVSQSQAWFEPAQVAPGGTTTLVLEVRNLGTEAVPISTAFNLPTELIPTDPSRAVPPSTPRLAAGERIRYTIPVQVAPTLTDTLRLPIQITGQWSGRLPVITAVATATLHLDPTLPTEREFIDVAATIQEGAIIRTPDITLALRPLSTLTPTWLLIREFGWDGQRQAWQPLAAGAWQPFRTVVPYRLHGGDGVKYLAVWVSDQPDRSPALASAILLHANLIGGGAPEQLRNTASPLSPTNTLLRFPLPEKAQPVTITLTAQQTGGFLAMWGGGNSDQPEGWQAIQAGTQSYTVLLRADQRDEAHVLLMGSTAQVQDVVLGAAASRATQPAQPARSDGSPRFIPFQTNPLDSPLDELPTTASVPISLPLIVRGE